jgi:NAD(P)-dependent dehydrogenase (short-subunit alcohol dehydrogenase family)
MRALIMGGTAGIGLATAELLTDAGMEVTVTGRDPEKLERARTRFGGAVALDGTDRGAVSVFLAEFGSFEHLVLAFSPGSIGVGPLKQVDFVDVETAVTAKLLPYLFAVREAQATESVTMISASGARAAVPGTVAFSASNGAIERVVSPLAAELAPVRVNAVSPGLIDTDWWNFLPEDRRQAQFEDAAKRVPLGRIGTSLDVAKAIAYLVDATYVTGTIMAVDGGTTVA